MTRARRERPVERAAAAVGLGYGGTLLTLVVLYRAELGEGGTLLAWSLSQLMIGSMAQGLASRLPWASLPWRLELRHVGLAVLTGLATFVIAWAFVAGVTALNGAAPEAEEIQPLLVLAMVVMAPVLEEWMCRGVLWSTLAPYSEPRPRIAATAVLFGLLHCLEGLLGFTHRFVAGLAFGWLREHTKSLAPPILAHATHNLACVVLAWWSD